MGMATRAELERSASDEGATARALELARHAEERHPESVGGRRGRSIRQEIESPTFYLQAMSGCVMLFGEGVVGHVSESLQAESRTVSIAAKRMDPGYHPW
jgi:hypothetical protein